MRTRRWRIGPHSEVGSIRAQLSPPEGLAESCGNAAALTWLGSKSVAAKRSGWCPVSGRSLSGVSTKSLIYPTDQCELLTPVALGKKCGSRFSLPVRRSTRHQLPGMIEPRSFLLDALHLFARPSIRRRMAAWLPGAGRLTLKFAARGK